MPMARGARGCGCGRSSNHHPSCAAGPRALRPPSQGMAYPGDLAARVAAAFPEHTSAPAGLAGMLQQAPAPGPAAATPSRTRSRSRRAMRPGAADRRPRTRGTLPDLSGEQARARALEDFDGDVYAESSRASLEYKWRTVCRMFQQWGVECFPPDVGKIRLLGASLKAGGYRTAAGYLSLYRCACARRGLAFDPAMATAIAMQRGPAAEVWGHQCRPPHFR